MPTYDWIVVGAGITGAALSYELATQGASVLLLDQARSPDSATRFSYGGIAYWAGTTDLTRQLCTEGIEIHRSLSAELDADTEFRELDLLLTIAPESDPDQIAASYAAFAIPPRSLSVDEACDLEPLLDPTGIAGALTVKHGHIHAGKTANAYIEAMQRAGGEYAIGLVTGLIRAVDRITGVTTSSGDYAAANVAICIGALTRQFLKTAGIPVTQYFTHAEIIEIAKTNLQLRTLVMPAEADRFKLEAAATRPELDPLWDQPGHEPAPAILDAGAIQFRDQRIYIGQTSRTLTDPNAAINAVESELDLRRKIIRVLPTIAALPGIYQRCLIAFSRDRLPLVGSTSGIDGIHVFSGFSNPLAIVPPLARRFAIQATGQPDSLLEALSPDRFLA